MRRLGVSVYPGHSEIEDILDYLRLAAKYGFSRVFTCLLSVGNQEKTIADFKEAVKLATSLGMEVIADVDLSVFEKLDLKYDNLEFFKDMGLTGIRLDGGFSGQEEAGMTFNPQGLMIELNMSIENRYLENIAAFQPKFEKLIGCHNFYPHRYSGLNLDFYKECTKRFNKYGLKTAAFVTSHDKGAFGPWPTTEGLPTLELHRELPLDVQIKHHIAMELVDDILISNCYPTKEELSRIDGLDLDVVTFDVELVEGIPEIEKKIVLEEFHFNRGDQNDYFIRSTQSRVKYKGHRFEVFNAPNQIKRGDILIESSEYGHYAGELQIALKDMENSGKTNVVGKVVDIEHFILDEIKPWQKFKFRLK